MKIEEFIHVPSYTTINDIISKNYTLSASQHKIFDIKNRNCFKLGELLEHKLTKKDLGTDVGSDNYVSFSNYKFIKTKAFQSDSFLLCDLKDATLYIKPNSFIDQNLKKGTILISKDSNVGEAIILDEDYHNAMICGAIYKLPIIKEKYYIFSYLKTQLFKSQIDFMIPKGATIKHGKTIFLDCLVPFPNQEKEKTIKYISELTKSIISKEKLIKEKYRTIINLIDKELKNNQSNNKFAYHLPTINEIKSIDRMDSCLYSKEFKKKEFLILNYKYGAKTVEELGFSLRRGQNLQISNIGKSIRTDEQIPGYYKLIMPNFITKYGTISSEEYIGNSHKLKTLNKGDLIFGAEGNEKGRSYVVLNNIEKTITNIHGLTLSQNNISIETCIFVKLFLDYYRSNGMIDAYAVGGNGGSLAIKYWKYLKFPSFPDEVKEKIVKLYYSKFETEKYSNCNLDNFELFDKSNENKLGIYELDIIIKKYKRYINETFFNIANDKKVSFVF